MVINGAGAAGIACARLYRDLGVPERNITLCDSKGVIYEGRREGMNPYKAEWAWPSSARTLADALRGADVFVGLSQAGLVSEDDGPQHGRPADHLRDGQSRIPRSRPTRCGARAPTRSWPRAAPTTRTR